MGVKYFCDRCNNEITDPVTQFAIRFDGGQSHQDHYLIVCMKCHDEVYTYATS
jgi:RNase P subunit RPR2